MTLSYNQTNIHIKQDGILVGMEHVLRINMIKIMIKNMFTMNVSSFISLYARLTKFTFYEYIIHR